jgi:NADH-quinone oxidoreductase subunit E
VRGSGRLLREMENALGVKPGEATEDMSFSLETVACFGACALAPVVVINDQVHRQQTAASLKKMVGDIRGRTRKGAVKPRSSRAKRAHRK